LKYSFTIFLFIVTCLNHLDIVELYNGISYCQKIHLNKEVNDNTKHEDESTQKEIKENLENQEKYCSRNYFLNQRFFCLLDNNRFITTNTVMNIHPFTDDIIQPPETIKV
jgi:hypothetical protein